MNNSKNKSLMKKYFYLIAIIFAFVACDNSEELVPPVKTYNSWTVDIPTSTLSYEERDIIKNMRAEYEAAIAERAAEDAAQNGTTL